MKQVASWKVLASLQPCLNLVDRRTNYMKNQERKGKSPASLQPCLNLVDRRTNYMINLRVKMCTV